ncbi:MAG: hypothetical protein AcusKO_33830 [Acuticoccus sp.]
MVCHTHVPSRPDKHRKGRGRLWRGSLTATVAGALVVAGTAMAQQQSGSTAPPPAVVVAPVVNQDVADSIDFTGRVQAIQSVEIQARVEGYLEEVAFQEGSNVKTGDLLYQIEQGPYQASLAQAQAQLASAKAQLASAQANLNNQELNLRRQQTLVQRDTVSQATVDDAMAQRDAAQADVQAANASIQNAEAQIQTAQLNLSYTTIKAPIDGRLGRTNVTIGNLVSQGSGTMATLVQLDPIRVAFSVPDTLYTNLVEQTGLNAEQAASRLFTPYLQLPNGKTYDKTGTIAFASNEIDPNTGTITAYANFANPQAVLLPGSFVVVKVEQATKTSEPVIQASAVIQDSQGKYVFVLNDKNVAEQRRVTVGQSLGAKVAVTDGLREGEMVVVEGVQKIRAGMTVTPTPLKSDPVALPKQGDVSTDDPAASIGSTPASSPGSGAASAGSGAATGGSNTGTGASTTGTGTAPASSGTSAAPASGDAGTAPAASASDNDSDTGAPAASTGTATPAGNASTAPTNGGDSTAPASSDSAPATDSTAPADSTPAAPAGDSAPAGDDSTAAPTPSDSRSSAAAPDDSSAAPAAADSTATTDSTAAPAAADSATATDAANAAATGDAAADTAATDSTAPDAAASTPAADTAASQDASAPSVPQDGPREAAAGNAPYFGATPPPRPGDAAPAPATNGGN